MYDPDDEYNPLYVVPPLIHKMQICVRSTFQDTFFFDATVEGRDGLIARTKHAGLKTKGCLSANVTVCVANITASEGRGHGGAAGEEKNRVAAEGLMVSAGGAALGGSSRSRRIHRMVRGREALICELVPLCSFLVLPCIAAANSAVAYELSCFRSN